MPRFCHNMALVSFSTNCNEGGLTFQVDKIFNKAIGTFEFWLVTFFILKDFVLYERAFTSWSKWKCFLSHFTSKQLDKLPLK